MYTIKEVVIGLLIASLIIGLTYRLSPVYEEDQKVKSLKEGQTWVYVLNKNNPYEDKKIYYKKIIEIKKGYVLYIENSKDTLNQKIKLFTVSSECIKDCN